MSFSLLVPLLLQSAAFAGTSAGVFFGCPAGQILEMAADPRAGRAADGATNHVVRCTRKTIVTPPQCPTGTALIAVTGPDQCGVVRSGTGSANGVSSAGRISDGTSNTILVGESTVASPTTGSAPVVSIKDGTSNTIALGEAAAKLQCGSGLVLIVDALRVADQCMKIEVSAPAVSVPVNTRR